jgi:hypothetical protein
MLPLAKKLFTFGKIGQLATHPVTFGIVNCYRAELSPQIVWFTCTNELGLLAVLQKIAPHSCTCQVNKQKLHSMALLEDATFGLYSAKYGIQFVCLKVLSSMH